MLYFRTSLNHGFRKYNKNWTAMCMCMKHRYTCLSNFWYTFEINALQNLIFRYFLQKQKITVQSYELVI